MQHHQRVGIKDYNLQTHAEIVGSQQTLKRQPGLLLF
jgi:hypothetical protein